MNHSVRVHPKTQKTIGNLYGQHVHTRNRRLTEDGIDMVSKTHLDQLKSSKIDSSKISSMSILECGGTGRDALAWIKLGAKEVTHVDISEQNVERLRSYCKEKNINNLRVILGDILAIDLPEGTFDIVRSRGVVHHLALPALALSRFTNWVKVGGFIHFNIYRGGTFYYYGVQQLRRSRSPDDFPYFLKVIEELNVSEEKAGILLDELFVPIMHTGTHSIILSDLMRLNLTILWPKRNFATLDHGVLYPDLPEKTEHIQYWLKKEKPLDQPVENVFPSLRYQAGVDNIEMANQLPEAEVSLMAFNEFTQAMLKTAPQLRARALTNVYLVHYYELCTKPMSSADRHKKLADALKEALSIL